MADRRYLDFELAIEALDGGDFRARVIDSPAGQARETFTFPLSPLEVENFILRVARDVQRGTRRRESPGREAARLFGARLFEAVFSGEVETCLRRSIDEAERTGQGLRIRLRLSDAPALAAIPWEYLYSASNDRFLVLSSWTPLVRYLDLPRRVTPLRVDLPVRILVMIASPTDYPALDVEAEWTRLNGALADLVMDGHVELHRLDDASLPALQRELLRRDYHAFHFIGHGGFDEPSGDGVLMLEGEAGRARVVSGRDLGTILHDHRSLRLAVLNACEGGRSSAVDPFSGSAQSLLRSGIPAVVAMQFEISDRAAVAFAHAFYGAVAVGLPVDAAVTEARKAVFGHGDDAEWGTPVVYMRSPDGRIFDVPQEQVEVPSTTDPPAFPESPAVSPPSRIAPVPLPPADPAPAPATPAPHDEPETVSHSSEEPVAEAPPSEHGGAAGVDMEPAPAPTLDVIPGVEPADDAATGPSLELVHESPSEPEPAPSSDTAAQPSSPPEPATTIDPEPAPGATAEPALDPEPPVPSDSPPDLAPLTPHVPAPRPVPLPPPARRPGSHGERVPARQPARPRLDGRPGSWPHRPGTRVAAVGVAAIVVAGALAAFALLRDSDDSAALPGETTPTNAASTATARLEEPASVAVDDPRVVARPLDGFTADGDLDEWSHFETHATTPYQVFTSQAANWDHTDDIESRWWLGFDSEHLYLAVSVTDDKHSQPSTGNQIYRGDAVDIHVGLDRGDTSAPNDDDFQVVLSPGNFADLPPSNVVFQGNGAHFDRDRISGGISIGASQTDSGYRIEAAIPWSELGLSGPPREGDEPPVLLLLSVFDNDGEHEATSGRVAQTVIKSHVDAGFQVPGEWGYLVAAD